MADEPQIDGRIVQPVQCAFLMQTKIGENVIYRCPKAAEIDLLIPAKAAGGMFFGEGVITHVCKPHANHLLERYDARIPT